VGTNGVACKSVGGRRYLGTERDERRAFELNGTQGALQERRHDA
jgi:hypothetical protein